MLHIVVFNGGLGNQMFQYAFYLALKQRKPCSFFFFDTTGTRWCHNGFELFDIFSIRGKLKVKLFNFFHYRMGIKLCGFNHITQTNALQYQEDYLVHQGAFCIYTGYWQSEKYFLPIADIVIKEFTFREDKLNMRSHQLAQKLKSNSFCSVHIRRGDYLKEPERGICLHTYYNDAIRYLEQSEDNIRFCFFSDDIQWCEEHLVKEEAIYVDWNTGKDAWQDMYLMSICKHNIIANSSFSWWGAWLNRNPDKIVIAPRQWFHNKENADIIPELWMKN